MTVVFILLGLVTIIVLGTWLSGFKKAKKMDVDEDAERASDAMQAFRRRQEEETIRGSRIKLKCLNCNHFFDGPMPESGCPSCHVASLVVAADRAPVTPDPGPGPVVGQVSQSPSAEEAHVKRPEV